MADEADIAAGNAEVALAAALSGIDRSIPAGVAGECEECGDWMERLVGGRCGFCRDGRRRRVPTFDRPVPVAPASTEESTVATTLKTVTVKVGPTPKPAVGETIKPITLPPHPAIYALVQERLAAHAAAAPGEDQLPLGRALVGLIEELLAKAELPPLTFAIDAVETSALLGELERRLRGGVAASDHQVALDRADAAEAKLAAAAQALGLAA